MILNCPKCGSGDFRNSMHVVWGAVCCKCGHKWQVIPSGSDPLLEKIIEPDRQIADDFENKHKQN